MGRAQGRGRARDSGLKPLPPKLVADVSRRPLAGMHEAPRRCRTCILAMTSAIEMHRTPLLLSILVLLAACGSVPRDAPTPASPVPAPEAPATLRIEGSASYRERIAVEGARLDVIVVDAAAADAAGQPDASVARFRFERLAGPPYAFGLELDRAHLRADARLHVRAYLRDSQGRLAFATPTRVAIVPGQPLDLRLVRVTPP